MPGQQAVGDVCQQRWILTEITQNLTNPQAKRVDVVVPGAVLLDELFAALNITEMRVSPFALREGVLQVHRLLKQ